MSRFDLRTIAGVALFTICSTAAQTAEQMTICHQEETISIDVSAWPAHQGHGDAEGECSESSGSGSGNIVFQMVVCSEDAGRPGRVVNLSRTGRVTVQESDCE